MKKFFVLFAILGFARFSHASFLLEPYLGYESGTATTEFTSGSSTSSSDSAYDAGVRIGWRNMGFWVAVDGTAGFSGKISDTLNEEYSSTTGYLAFGYDFMSRFRIMAGYGFLDTWTIKATSSTVETTYYNGYPIKAGIGYWIRPHFCINVEYIMHSYKNVKTSTSDVTTTSAGYDSVKNNVALLTLSFPL